MLFFARKFISELFEHPLYYVLACTYHAFNIRAYYLIKTNFLRLPEDSYSADNIYSAFSSAVSFTISGLFVAIGRTSMYDREHQKVNRIHAVVQFTYGMQCYKS